MIIFQSVSQIWIQLNTELCVPYTVCVFGGCCSPVSILHYNTKRVRVILKSNENIDNIMQSGATAPQTRASRQLLLSPHLPGTVLSQQQSQRGWVALRCAALILAKC